MRPSYLKKAFAIKNFKNNMKECKADVPGYIKNLDLKAIKKACAQHKVVYFKTNVKKGEKIKVLIKRNNKTVLRQKATAGEYMYVIVQKDMELDKDYSISYRYRKKEIKVKKVVPKKKKSPARMQQEEEEEGMLLEEAQADYPQGTEYKSGSIKTLKPSGKVTRVYYPSITLEREDGSEAKRMCADGLGFFTFSMVHGAYSMTVEKEGYMPLKKYMYAAGSSDACMDDLFLYPMQEGDGSLEGKITDGPSGAGVPGLYLTVREGYDNTEGKVTASAYTDAAGNYTLQDIPTGYYCVEFEDRDLTRIDAGEGYEDNYFNVFIESGKTGHKNSYAYRRFGAQNTLELVVHWTKPEGVDHPAETIRLYLFSPRGSYDMCLYDGYQKISDGLVAETIFNREFLQRDETKRMSNRAYIYDCTRTSFIFYVATDRGGHYLPLTDAVAEVYYDGQLVQSFALPQGEEDYWDVCAYDAETGEFTPGGRTVDHNTFYNEAWNRMFWLAYGEERPDEN